MAGEQQAWADRSLSRLRALVGDEILGQQLATPAPGSFARAATDMLDDLQARTTHLPRKDEAQGMYPYAHPYYWAAFTLICGALSPTAA
jgi:CHAT domain-containing protein